MTAKYSASDGALNSTLHSWARSACPFEETRHSCYYINQSNADEVATRGDVMPSRCEPSWGVIPRGDIVFVTYVRAALKP